MDIYKVSVCKFVDSENYCYVERLIVENYYDHYCGVDFTTNIATDIFSGDQFYILKKDKNNRILASEAPKINFTDYFGVGIDKVKLDTLPGSEQLKLKTAYLKHKLKNGQKGKQKVIKR